MTEIVILMDESGSMDRVSYEAVDGYNKFLESQRGTDAKISVVLFNEKPKRIRDREPLSQTPYLSTQDYRPNGGTAIYDSVWEALEYHVGKYESEEKKPDVIFLLLTDGQDLDSSIDPSQVKKRVMWVRENYKWKFWLIGVGNSSYETAKSLGITRVHRFGSSLELASGAFGILTEQVNLLRLPS